MPTSGDVISVIDLVEMLSRPDGDDRSGAKGRWKLPSTGSRGGGAQAFRGL
jgi:hypothetical protein